MAIICLLEQKKFQDIYIFLAKNQPAALKCTLKFEHNQWLTKDFRRGGRKFGNGDENNEDQKTKKKNQNQSVFLPKFLKGGGGGHGSILCTILK